MSGFFVSNKNCEHVDDLNLLLKRRGPDRTIVDKVEKLDIIYNILALNNESEYWYKDDNYIVLFDGIIFNCPDHSIKGIARYLLDMYIEHSIFFTRMLDGEYAICLVDLKNSLCIFSSDVFGTRPMWYAITEQWWCISSYKSAIQRNGHANIKRTEPNLTYYYNYRTNVLQQYVIHNFSLTQYKDSFDDWIYAFEKAIFKRANGQAVHMGLSSGYDSGAIFCELNKKDYEFAAISFKGIESEDILLKRIKMKPNSLLLEYEEREFLLTLKELVRYCEPYENKHYDILKDESSIGIGIMCKNAKKHGVKILLSGSCADGILSYLDWEHYPIKESPEKFENLFPKDLSSIFPWQNFFYGSREAFVSQEEFVSGMYGVQVRYPFLDTALVQEFLWLDYKLKNKNYKAPIHDYFERNEFPFEIKKTGFFLRKG